MSCWALVPLKERAACKLRLAPILPPRARLRLVRTLLHHVIDTLRNTPGIAHIAIVSSERDDVPADIVLLPRERQGLNNDLTHALGEVAERGATRAVIIPGDLPLLDPADVSALLDCMERSGVGLAPDRHGLGTNALALAMPSPLTLAFGDSSFARHLVGSRSRGIEPGVLHRTGFSVDIDNVDDLRYLQAFPLWASLMQRLDFDLQASTHMQDISP